MVGRTYVLNHMRIHFVLFVSASKFIRRRLKVMCNQSAYALYIDVVGHTAKQ